MIRNHLPWHVLCAATGPFFGTRQKEDGRDAAEGRLAWHCQATSHAIPGDE